MKRAVPLVTLSIFFGHALFAMANTGQGVLLSSFIDAFSLTSSWQGVPNAAANLGVIVAMLLSVSMAARVGKPALFAIGLGIMALMLFLAGASSSALGLAVSYLAMGFAFGCVDTTASAIIADLHQGKRAALFMGMLHAAYGAGGILAPLWMTAILEGGGTWRAALYALATAAVVAFFVCAFVFTRARNHLPASAAPPRRPTRRDVAAFFTKKGNGMLVLSTALYCAHQCSVYLWIGRIISVGYGNAALGAAAISLFWVGTVLSRVLVPLLGLRTAPYIRYGMLLTAAILLGSWIFASAPVLIAAAGLSGLLGGATMPMAISEGTRRNPDLSMLTVTALLLTTALSAIICAPLIGFIVSRTALIAGVAVSAVAALGCALTAFGIKDEKPVAG